MRIWSIHPKYLDAKGLVALWRETLLAKHVLEGRTQGYRNHPQLTRFKGMAQPVDGIHQYLSEVFLEAQKRGYHFDRKKLDWHFKPAFLTVTAGQMSYERAHLLRKLEIRAVQKLEEVMSIRQFEPHPIFKIIDGPIEAWEVVSA